MIEAQALVAFDLVNGLYALLNIWPSSFIESVKPLLGWVLPFLGSEYIVGVERTLGKVKTASTEFVFLSSCKGRSVRIE
jgi:hypothetical protein